MPKKGIKAWQTEVSDNDSWKMELGKPGLMIVELFSEFFGYCEILTPMIDDIMKRAPDIRWRRLNVLKLEEELSSMDDEKNRSSREKEVGGGDEDGAEQKEKSDDATQKAASAPSTVACLEKFKGFHHPQPFFLFMRKGEILDILRSCDPPKLETLTTLYANDPEARNKDITFEIMKKTEEELQAEKAEAARVKAHLKNVYAIIERLEFEDPMAITADESIAIFEMFCIDGEFKGHGVKEDSNWQQLAITFEGKSVDAVGEHLSSIDAEMLKTLQSNLDAKSAPKADGNAEPQETAAVADEDQVKEATNVAEDTAAPE